jgi:arylsulfatase A-like enzyme
MGCSRVDTLAIAPMRWTKFFFYIGLSIISGFGVNACGVRSAPDLPNILLVTMETTRADHLGAYGYARPTSPNFDRLAARGVLFESALTVSPRTNPSVASLMTSLYPHEHRVRSLLRPLTTDARTLAEILRGAGYRTGAIQTHHFMKSDSGLAQGFDTYEDSFMGERRADEAARLAVRWIERGSRSGRPWFLWVHMVDPHWPYEPPAQTASLFGPADPRTLDLYRDLSQGRVSMGSVIFRNGMSPDLVQSFVNLYDGEIRFMDDALGAILAAVDVAEVRERTIVAVTSDHGEALGEHDYYFEHGDFGTTPEIHVPLAFAAPGLVPPGIRVPSTVRSIDVAPTILELAGLPAELQFRGLSMLPMLRGGGGGEDRACFGEAGASYHLENSRREIEGADGKWRWMQRGRYKLVHIPRQSRPPIRRLYDLRNDPGETANLLIDLRGVAVWMERDLDTWLTEGELAAGPAMRIDRVTFERLKSFDYLN